jgi:hypothetical protein
VNDSEPTGTTTTVASRHADVPRGGNAEFQWDSFDSEAYYSHNYDHLRKDDAQIIRIVSDYFQSHDRRSGRSAQLVKAIDVGSGTNLYPALTMLPYASEITLFEHAYTNREWLVDSLTHPQKSWKQEFWAEIAEDRPAYENIRNPLDTLATRARIERGNVFELAPAQYGMGTMFFVAESITARNDEFRRATRKFVDSLLPNAPFAAAFMSGSAGYYVAGLRFPACAIGEKDIRTCLEPAARIDDIRTVESNDLREGYCGMIVATGRKR